MPAAEHISHGQRPTFPCGGSGANPRLRRTGQTVLGFLLALGTTFGAGPGQALQAQEMTGPVRDVLNLCSHQTGERQTIVETLVNTGWKTVTRPVPAGMHDIMADGDLINAFVDPRAISSGVDTETGEIPDMAESIEGLMKATDRGIWSTLWWPGDDHALLLIRDGLNSREDIVCRLYGSNPDDIAPVLSAIREFDSPGTESRHGPVAQTKMTFSGIAPTRPNTGLSAMLAKLGILPSPPVLEPQLGVGRRSKISVYSLDSAEFFNRFGRGSSTSFILWVTRPPQSEANQ
jgi:hypothetical protein